MGVCVCLPHLVFFLEGTLVHHVFTALCDNGLYDTLIDLQTIMDLRVDEGVETPQVFFISLDFLDFHLVCCLW